MSGEVNMIPTLRKIRGGASPSKFGGGQSGDIVRGGPVKKSPCMISELSVALALYLHIFDFFTYYWQGMDCDSFSNI